MPHSSNLPYDMLELIKLIVDDEEIFQMMPAYAKNIITCFARVNGQTVGIVANQPMVAAGDEARLCCCSCIRMSFSFSVRLPGHQFERQSRPVRPVLRRVQHSAADFRRRARLPSRSVFFCRFSSPSLSLSPLSLYLGTGQEYGGIIRHGAKLIYAYAGLLAVFALFFDY